MEFRLTEEDEDLRAVVRDFLAAESPESAVRAAGEQDRHDERLWSRMAELGLLSIAVPTRHGGAGYGFVQLGVVLEELDAALAVTPFLGTCVMAAELITGLGDEGVCARYLPAISSGDLVVGVAAAEDSGSWRADDVTAVAVRHDDRWRISGVKSFVLDGAAADLLLVVARVDDAELGVFAVDPTARGLRRQPLDSWDRTRKQARIEFDGVSAELLAAGAPARGAVERMLDRTAIAVAAGSVGGMARSLGMAVEHAKQREQFGRAIGSFQAIKHKCATVLVDLESARSASLYATWAAATGHEDVARAAPMTKAFCADAYLHAAMECIQILGGIGYTWEHPAHLYLKRARADQAFLGGSDLHRRLYADRLGIGAPAAGSRH